MDLEQGKDQVESNAVILPKQQQDSGSVQVQVAVRIRPFIQKELNEREPICIKCYNEQNMILIGKDKQFSFDKTFDQTTPQQQVYESCVKSLVVRCLEGYNATVLAYGQTGSGKTYTMGTSFSPTQNEQEIGIIKRVVQDIFNIVKERSNKSQFNIQVTYYEIYNENIIDLLDFSQITRGKEESKQKEKIVITEENGQINVQNLEKIPAKDQQDIFAALEKGAMNRTTSATLMNQTSSRSHAIFTIYIEQQALQRNNNPQQQQQGSNQLVQQKVDTDNGFTNSKFHFVDLAGSERIKKTGAIGSTLKEGININMGLLALGNVISALTDKKSDYIPYRNSKLTRILQDSLGGNSNTCMIACVSPAESNYEETLSTLKYADRARKIKNKPIVNRDPRLVLIQQLRQQISEQQVIVMKFKKLLIGNGIQFEDMQAKSNNGGNLQSDDNQIMQQSRLEGNFMCQDITEKQKELFIVNVKQEKQIKQLEDDLHVYKKKLSETEVQLHNIIKERDHLRLYFEKATTTLQQHKIIFQLDEQDDLQRKSIIEQYKQQMDQVKSELLDKEKYNQELQSSLQDITKSSQQDHKLLVQKTNKIRLLTQQITQLEKIIENQKKQDTSPVKMSIEFDKTSFTNSVLKTEIEEDEQNIQIPTLNTEIDEIELDQKLEQDAELLIKEQELNDKSNQVCEQLQQVAVNISSKEQELRDITNQQIKTQTNLVSEMSQKYYLKISELEKEMKTLQQQRDQAITKLNFQEHGSKDANKNSANIKAKIADLETKISELKKKEKKQEQLHKTVQDQDQKIKLLSEDIKQFKKQKLDLNHQLRENHDQFEKFKQKKLQDLILEKRKNKEQSIQINRLKFNNNQKARQINLKDLFIQKLKHQNELYHNIITPKNTDISNNHRNSKPNKHFSSNKNLLDQNLSEVQILTEENAQIILHNSLVKMLEIVESEDKLQKEEHQLKQVEENLVEEQKKLTEILIVIDKLEIERQDKLRDGLLDEEDEDNYQQTYQTLQTERDDLQSSVESLEDKLKYKTQRQNELVQLLKLKTVEQIQQQFMEDAMMRNNSNCKMLLKVLIDKYLISSDAMLKKEESILCLKSEVEELKQQLEQMENNFKELQKDYTKKFEELNSKRLMSMNDNNSDNENDGGDQMDKEEDRDKQSNISPIKKYFKQQENGVIEENQKQLQRKIYELKRKIKQLEIQNDKLTNINNVQKQKIEALKSIPQKDKFIGKPIKTEPSGSADFQNLQFSDSLNQEDILNFQHNDQQKLQQDNQNYFKKPIVIQELTNIQQKRMQQKAEKLKNNNNNTNQIEDKNIFNLEIFNQRPKSNSITLDEKNTKPVLQQPKTNKNDQNKIYKDSPKRIFNEKGIHTQKNQYINLNSNENIDNTPEDFIPQQAQQQFVIGSNPKQFNAPNDSNQLNLKWDIVANIDAKVPQVYCIASSGNLLYSTSNKQLKVWDIETQKCISDIQSPFIPGFIKGLTIWPEQQVIVTSCDKNIQIWDMFNMKLVQTLKGHNGEIKTLYVTNNKLFSAGASYCHQTKTNGNALLVWDIKKSQQPLDEKEKNQDIFTLQAHNDILYYGCRDHSIRRLKLSNLEIMSQFESPHYDAVTALAIMKDCLISGSKDKHLKLWNLDSPLKKPLESVQFVQFNEQITTLQTNQKYNILYSGLKDGKVKVLTLQNNKLRNIYDINNQNTSSINSLCNLQENNDKIVAMAQERYISFWKPTRSTVDKLLELESSNPGMDIENELMN